MKRKGQAAQTKRPPAGAAEGVVAHQSSPCLDRRMRQRPKRVGRSRGMKANNKPTTPIQRETLELLCYAKRELKKVPANVGTIEPKLSEARRNLLGQKNLWATFGSGSFPSA